MCWNNNNNNNNNNNKANAMVLLKLIKVFKCPKIQTKLWTSLQRPWKTRVWNSFRVSNPKGDQNSKRYFPGETWSRSKTGLFNHVLRKYSGCYTFLKSHEKHNDIYIGWTKRYLQKKKKNNNKHKRVFDKVAVMVDCSITNIGLATIFLVSLNLWAEK